jgi:hypothetical protein
LLVQAPHPAAAAAAAPIAAALLAQAPAEQTWAAAHAGCGLLLPLLVLLLLTSQCRPLQPWWRLRLLPLPGETLRVLRKGAPGLLHLRA